MRVDVLRGRRADLLRRANKYPERSAEDLAGGRILLYAPEDNLCDGAAQYASKGFFDVDNIRLGTLGFPLKTNIWSPGCLRCLSI
jgi:hypothetical protein